ncbi:hypothetical protein NBRGN_027_02280 [Nocardia brasiliensis NBRC 14402]|uniref:hypothetical protein n=1 Tax=Nocardia brasiliensis TaxID=37326 RepID=UPI0002DEED1D|nr:hypothetical protein [Nocardia brasiliensis]GAJ80571.1 hypothetical protein NBRGN_027_02280 [Nocardia brasiliensis NBRC 14402]SUB10835.1 Uncharacterised protein [Nocardia brasiliensis]
MRDRDTRDTRDIRTRGSRRTGTRLFSTLLLIWLVIGLLAAGQRHYFQSGPTNCAGWGTIAVTTIAGPLNYFGVNPKVSDCVLPEPSQ